MSSQNKILPNDLLREISNVEVKEVNGEDHFYCVGIAKEEPTPTESVQVHQTVAAVEDDEPVAEVEPNSPSLAPEQNSVPVESAAKGAETDSMLRFDETARAEDKDAIVRDEDDSVVDDWEALVSDDEVDVIKTEHRNELVSESTDAFAD